MGRYLLLLRESPSEFAEMPPEEMRAVIEKYVAWRKKIEADGHYVGGEKLRDDGGRHLRKDGGRLDATDGPFAEAKEIVGGYFMIEAADDREAERVAAGCPHLEHGWIELRAVETVPE